MPLQLSGSNRWQLDTKIEKVTSLSLDRGTLTYKSAITMHYSGDKLQLETLVVDFDGSDIVPLKPLFSDSRGCRIFYSLSKIAHSIRCADAALNQLRARSFRFHAKCTVKYV